MATRPSNPKPVSRATPRSTSRTRPAKPEIAQAIDEARAEAQSKSAPREHISHADFDRTIKHTRYVLSQQKTIEVFINRPFGADPEKATHLIVGINGTFFYIPYEKYVDVYESVYEVLVSGIANWSGKNPTPFVMPRDEKYAHLLPTTSPTLPHFEYIKGKEMTYFERD